MTCCATLLACLGACEPYFTIIGVLAVAKFALTNLWPILKAFRAHCWSRLRERNFVEEYGKWAVVTGSTDGIGKEYARELAKRGMNVVLVSRTLAKLQKVAAEIVKDFGVKAEIVQADFSDGHPIYEGIAKHLKGKEIGVLVNNVGVLGPHPMKFNDMSEKVMWDHVNVNVASVPAMTRLVLPGMLQRGRGAIVNVSSAANIEPIPYLGIYSATKAFVDFFSGSLEYEYRGTGVTVQCLMPSYVSTNMTDYSDLVHKPGVWVPTSQQYASSAINTLGYTNRSTGYWSHGIKAHLLEKIARSWFTLYLSYTWHEKQLRNLKKKN